MIKIKKATLENIEYLLDHLKKSDKQEMIEVMKEKSFEDHCKTLKNCFMFGDCKWWAVFYNHDLLCVFGIQELCKDIASVFMLSTTNLAKHKKLFLKATSQIKTIATKKHRYLFNYVFLKNKSAIRYLKFVGAEFKNIFDKDKKFQFFQINR